MKIFGIKNSAYKYMILQGENKRVQSEWLPHSSGIKTLLFWGCLMHHLKSEWLPHSSGIKTQSYTLYDIIFVRMIAPFIGDKKTKSGSLKTKHRFQAAWFFAPILMHTNLFCSRNGRVLAYDFIFKFQTREWQIWQLYLCRATLGRLNG